jgi:hypothetical protein
MNFFCVKILKMNNICSQFRNASCMQTGHKRFDIYEVASFGNLKLLICNEIEKNRRLEHPVSTRSAAGSVGSDLEY